MRTQTLTHTRTHRCSQTHTVKRPGKGLKPSSVFQAETIALLFCDLEPFHLFMIKHQVREFLSPTIVYFQEVPKPRGRPLSVCFLGLWAEMKGREREQSSLTGIFMLLEVTSRLPKTPGPDPPSTPLPTGEESGRAWEEGTCEQSLLLGSRLQRSFVYASLVKALCPSLLPTCLHPGWNLNIEKSVSVWFQENRAKSAVSHQLPSCSLQFYKIQNSACKMPRTIITFCERSNNRKTDHHISLQPISTFYFF